MLVAQVMSSDGIDQELKGVFTLKKARSGGRKQPCSEDLSGLGLIPKQIFLHWTAVGFLSLQSCWLAQPPHSRNVKR